MQFWKGAMVEDVAFRRLHNSSIRIKNVCWAAIVLHVPVSCSRALANKIHSVISCVLEHEQLQSDLRNLSRHIRLFGH